MLNYRQSALVRFIARRRALRSDTPGHIDESNFVDGEPELIKHVSGSDVPRGAPYFVRGWAIDLGRKQIPWEVRVDIDGKDVPARVHSKLPRPDIARSFGFPELLFCGFTGLVDTGSLAVGPHELRIRAIVGRYGTAFARIPATIRFFVLNYIATAFAPPSLMVSSPTFALDPVSAFSTGSVLALSGSALDDRERPLASVAARIDDNAWNEGWTGIERSYTAPQGKTGSDRAGFCVRIRLDTIAAGLHRVRLAGKTLDGQWIELGSSRQLTVASAPAFLSPWAKALIDSGNAVITDAEGTSLTRLPLYRVRSAISVRGNLRRSSPIGSPITLIARASNDNEYSLAAWSAPTDNPQLAIFGAEISERALAPETYRLFVDAPDRSGRFVGRADTGCDLIVQRRPPLSTDPYSADRLLRPTV